MPAITAVPDPKKNDPIDEATVLVMSNLLNLVLGFILMKV